jgi:hypothetical protein
MADRYCNSGVAPGGDGTVGDPWDTLAVAYAGSTDGDTINLIGNFVESLQMTTAGKSLAWVSALGTSITASGATSFIIEQKAAVGMTWENVDFHSNTNTVSLYSQKNDLGSTAIFTDCSFICDTATAANPFLIRLDGAGNIFDGCTFNITGGNGVITLFITLHASSLFDFTVNNSTITTTVATRPMSIGANNNINTFTFTGNTCTLAALEGATQAAFWHSSLSGDSVETAIMTGNTITVAEGTAIFARNATASTITGNTVNATDGDAIRLTNTLTAYTANVSNNDILVSDTITASDAIVIGNSTDKAFTATIDNNRITLFFGNGISVGSSETSTATISRNLIKRSQVATGGWCISTNFGDAAGGKNNITALVEKNIILTSGYYSPTSGNGDHAIANFFQTAEIRYNLLWGGGYGVVAKHDGSSEDGGSVHHNVFIDCGMAGDGGSIHLKGIKGVEVYNNTIVNDVGTSIHSGINAVKNSTIPAENNTIKNNLFLIPDNIPQIDLAADCTATVNNNLYWDKGGVAAEVKFKVDSTTYTGLAAWQAVHPEDTASIVDNPDVVSTRDPVISFASPAILAGENMGAAYATSLNPVTRFHDATAIFTGEYGFNIGAYGYIGNANIQ